ncbi:hypothetical protein F511_33879 [Dorcoceras hygrometricum]|uniref:Uncharacterized protein n=1 Tax=Dorcoceras hygrometricum TaxID=472368 RepID=A0A2Z7C3Z8_9LAMI|nr:hypothetical protein F511_33879 [Dorcoceras hygrometricum]
MPGNTPDGSRTAARGQSWRAAMRQGWRTAGRSSRNSLRLAAGHCWPFVARSCAKQQLVIGLHARDYRARQQQEIGRHVRPRACDRAHLRARLGAAMRGGATGDSQKF